jgi:hypothetical protein
LPLSARIDIKLLMGKMLPFSEDGSLDFISTSASFLASGFSS